MPNPAQRRRVLAIAVVRGLSIATVLTVAYFVLPLEELAKLPFGLIVGGGVVLLAAVIVYQVGAIFRAAYPAAKAVEALALTGPLFLLALRLDLLPDVASGPWQLQPVGAHAQRHPLLHRHRLHYGRLWRHCGHQPQRPHLGDGPDDPQPGPDRRRDQILRRSGQDGPPSSARPVRGRLKLPPEHRVKHATEQDRRRYVGLAHPPICLDWRPSLGPALVGQR